MWKRLKVWFARALTRGTECTVVRSEYVGRTRGWAIELQEYVERSGALQDSSRIHAWRQVHGLSTQIRNAAAEMEVAPALEAEVVS